MCSAYSLGQIWFCFMFILERSFVDLSCLTSWEFSLNTLSSIYDVFNFIEKQINHVTEFLWKLKIIHTWKGYCISKCFNVYALIIGLRPGTDVCEINHKFYFWTLRRKSLFLTIVKESTRITAYAGLLSFVYLRYPTSLKSSFSSKLPNFILSVYFVARLLGFLKPYHFSVQVN